MNKPHPTNRDGLWHSVTPVQRTERIKVYRNTVAKTVYRGRAVRFLDGKWEEDTCWHNHYKRGAAQRCSDRAANAQNRIDKKKENAS